MGNKPTKRSPENDRLWREQVHRVRDIVMRVTGMPQRAAYKVARQAVVR